MFLLNHQINGNINIDMNRDIRLNDKLYYHNTRPASK